MVPDRPADETEEARQAARPYDGYENRLYLDPIFRAGRSSTTTAINAPPQTVTTRAARC